MKAYAEITVYPLASSFFHELGHATGNDMLRYMILIMNLGFAMTLNLFAIHF